LAAPVARGIVRQLAAAVLVQPLPATGVPKQGSLAAAAGAAMDTDDGTARHDDGSAAAADAVPDRGGMAAAHAQAAVLPTPSPAGGVFTGDALATHAGAAMDDTDDAPRTSLLSISGAARHDDGSVTAADVVLDRGGGVAVAHASAAVLPTPRPADGGYTGGSLATHAGAAMGTDDGTSPVSGAARHDDDSVVAASVVLDRGGVLAAAHASAAVLPTRPPADGGYAGGSLVTHAGAAMNASDNLTSSVAGTARRDDGSVADPDAAPGHDGGVAAAHAVRRDDISDATTTVEADDVPEDWRSLARRVRSSLGPKHPFVIRFAKSEVGTKIAKSY